MNEIGHVKGRQKEWAIDQGFDLDQDNYVKDMEKNFFTSLSDETIRDLKGGDGAEIKDDKTRTKVYATHSSSALVCNVFEYWRYRDKSVLATALKLSKGIKTLSFEQKLSMGMQGSMPNLDLFLILEDGQAVAVESKFTEWMSKSSRKELFAESYFKNGMKRWSDVGLPNCQELAEKLNENPDEYQYLNAAQLLKHALGLANMHTNRSKLIYLYYEYKNSDISKIHMNEIRNFSEGVRGELNFSALTYQDMYNMLKDFSSELEEEYLGYLKERYFLKI